ncbi:MAG: hypothetical protein HC804_14730, partial [Anaerolineae bacterium]|nr:hypothetical protein [Anaerolineae bacterium]
MNTTFQEQQAIETMWARLWRVTVLFGLIALALGLFALLNPQASAALPIQLLGG